MTRPTRHLRGVERSERDADIRRQEAEHLQQRLRETLDAAAERHHGALQITVCTRRLLDLSGMAWLALEELRGLSGLSVDQLVSLAVLELAENFGGFTGLRQARRALPADVCAAAATGHRPRSPDSGSDARTIDVTPYRPGGPAA